MGEVAEKIQKMGVVPVVVLNDAKDAAPLRGRTSLRGSDVPHGCGGRVDPDDDDRVSGDVRRGRYGAHHRPG